MTRRLRGARVELGCGDGLAEEVSLSFGALEQAHHERVGEAQALPTEPISETIGRADAALYRAKEEGRDLVRTARSPGPTGDAEGGEAGLPV